ncbi:hypothetical protein ACFCWY_19335 [Streptomyces sp. NPDC056362]|uniref:hypothetical protein n=1 Tax=unclassified Streptomyces TaxID=2593676 RepID=UPI0035DC8DBA
MRTLPWSVEPMPGWASKVNDNTGGIVEPGRYVPRLHPRADRRGRPAARLVRDLSDKVSTHPFWGTLERGPQLVDARTALKSHSAITAGRPAVVEAA